MAKQVLYEVATKPFSGVILRKTVNDDELWAPDMYQSWSPAKPEWKNSNYAFGAFTGFEDSERISEEVAMLAIEGGPVGLAELFSLYYSGDSDALISIPDNYHPAVVADKMEKDDEKIVAFLHGTHNTYGNTGLDGKDISRIFGPKILTAVNAITRNKSENYDEYIRRCSKNTLARRVKIVDLDCIIENINSLETVTDEEKKRLRKYEDARDYLKHVDAQR